MHTKSSLEYAHSILLVKEGSGWTTHSKLPGYGGTNPVPHTNDNCIQIPWEGEVVRMICACLVHIYLPSPPSRGGLGLLSSFLSSERLHQFARQEEVFLEGVEGAFE